MSDNTPSNPVLQVTDSASFLKLVAQGQTWIHRDMGKIRITGVIRERNGNVLEVCFKQLTPAPERAAAALKYLVSGIEKLHVTEKRRVRETVEYAPNKAA